MDRKSAPTVTNAKNLAGVVSRNPIFIGGHPRPMKIRGLKSREQFVGCIDDVKINDQDLNLDPERAFGEVSMGICPTT